MLISILLIPLKLIVKAVLYILSAVFRAVAWIIGLPAMILQSLLTLIGGIGIVALTIMVAVGMLTDKSDIFMYYGISAGIILLPLILKAMMSGCFDIYGFFKRAAEDIALID